jgi:hypothetical protein
MYRFREEHMGKTLCKAVPLAIGFVLVATGMAWLTSHAKAQELPSSDLFAYPMSGIARGQTARVSVVTVGLQSAVSLELSFLDSQGTTLARSVERALPGQAVSLDLHFASVPATTASDLNRHQIRALVKMLDQPRSGGYVLHSIEVIDDLSGRTSVLCIDKAG